MRITAENLPGIYARCSEEDLSHEAGLPPGFRRTRDIVEGEHAVLSFLRPE